MDALVSYSDACTLPSLTPSCPFYVLSAAGPVCKDECRDLINTHGAADRRVREVVVGGGLVLVGRGLPITAACGHAPYDAAQHFISDRLLPPQEQHTGSLLLGLQAGMNEPPLFEVQGRVHRVRGLWAELERRGVPVGRVVKAAILPAVSTQIGALAAVPALRENEFFAPEVSTEALDTMERFADGGWHEALNAAIAAEGSAADALGVATRTINTGTLTARLSIPDFSGIDDEAQSPQLPTPEQVERLLADGRSIFGLSMRFTDRVYAWLCRLLDEDDLERLLAWGAPNAGLFLAIPLEKSVPADELGLWIWERFTVTDLHNWADTSLQQEWRHQAGDTLPIPRTVWAERSADPARVGALALERLGAQVQPESRRGLEPDQFVGAAVELLQAGRIQEAANIFEGLVEMRSGDGDALNNLGFCLLPLDAERGLELLQRASLYRPTSPLVNAANRVLALRLVGRTRSATELAREVLAAEPSDADPETPAWLWVERADGGLDLVQGDAQAYLRAHAR